LRAERSPARRSVLRSVLATNLSRIQEGYETICQHLIPGEHGQEFMKGFSRWTEETIRAGKDLLSGADYALRSASAAAAQGPDEEQRTVAAKPLPDIDTRSNTIRTSDREVEVLLTFNTPRIVLLGSVLSDEECDALTEYCKSRLLRSTVMSGLQGTVQVHENRTSYGVDLRLGETALVAKIEARLAALANWPVERGENMQVLRYNAGEEYRAHFDWMNPGLPALRKHMGAGGQRLGTFVLYLSTVESGGGTSFPAVGLDVMPKKGGAVFFVNTDSQYVPDQLTLHAGSPVIKGVKFIANKWLLEREP
jgi:prolyl 4-hydroxylase